MSKRLIIRFSFIFSIFLLVASCNKAKPDGEFHDVTHIMQEAVVVDSTFFHKIDSCVNLYVPDSMRLMDLYYIRSSADERYASFDDSIRKEYRFDSEEFLMIDIKVRKDCPYAGADDLRMVAEYNGRQYVLDDNLKYVRPTGKTKRFTDRSKQLDLSKPLMIIIRKDSTTMVPQDSEFYLVAHE